jgi:ADP-L-glycero-D-manno-heptose 6-epimerase
MFDLWLLENKLINKAVGLKYFNVFGPNENHKGDMRSMVNKAYSQILQTGRINLFKSYNSLYKDGEQKRDFIYIKDAADMTVFFDSSNPVGSVVCGIFNIGSGNAGTWIELANAVFFALDLKPQINFIEMPDEIKNQYQYYSCAVMSKLYAAGYDKALPLLTDGVNDYVRNYLQRDKYLGEE